MKERFKYNDVKADEKLSEEDIVTYIRSFKDIYAIHRKLGIRAPQCGDFLEALTRYKLGLKKPPKGDAVDTKDRLIEIKSSVLSEKLNYEDNSVFSIRENAEEAFDDLIFTAWDPRENKIFIYDTNLSSAEFRQLTPKRLTVEQEHTAGRKTFISLQKKVVDVLNLNPVCIYNIIE